MQLVLVSCLIAVACGQHHHNLNTHQIQQLVDSGFETLDVNPNDGLLEYNELAKIFDQRDVNTDGFLTKAEFEAHVGLDFLFKEPLFGYFDKNHDGFLDKAEFVDTGFQNMNHNHDDIVTKHEFDQYYTQLIHHLNTHHG